MARKIRDAGFDSRTARGKLKARGKPYYTSIGEGLHLGYRKERCRGQMGGSPLCRRRRLCRGETIATTPTILWMPMASAFWTFFQAQDRARQRGGELVYSGPYRVRGCRWRIISSS